MITESSRELLTQSTERVVASTTAFGWSDSGFAGQPSTSRGFQPNQALTLPKSGFAYEQLVFAGWQFIT
jgi:hypothetical protein